jgi:hypothetical protein
MKAQIIPRNMTSLPEPQIPVVMYSTGLSEHVTASTLRTTGHLSFKWILIHYSLNFGLWPGFDAFRCTVHQHNTSHQQGAHLIQHIQAQRWTDDGVRFYSFIYRGLILSDNYHLSLRPATPPHVWAVSWMGYVNLIYKLTESGNQQLSHKTMTLYDT